MAADPVTPSLVALIEAAAGSACTPVTRPVAETVAREGLLLSQVTTRSVSTFPAPSFTVATSNTVSPTSTVWVAGATVRDATGDGPRGTGESLLQAASRKTATATSA